MGGAVAKLGLEFIAHVAVGGKRQALFGNGRSGDVATQGRRSTFLR